MQRYFQMHTHNLCPCKCTKQYAYIKMHNHACGHYFYCNASHKLTYLHKKYSCYTPVRRQVNAPHKHPTSQLRQNAIARLLTIEIINNYYKHAKIKSPYQNSIHSEPVDGRTMPKRQPADDRRIYCRPTATGRCPGSHRWGACRSSSGHRPKILSSAERIGRWPNSLPAAAGRRPLPDFYDMVQGRENPAMICRCQKVGIL